MKKKKKLSILSIIIGPGHKGHAGGKKCSECGQPMPVDSSRKESGMDSSRKERTMDKGGQPETFDKETSGSKMTKKSKLYALKEMMA